MTMMNNENLSLPARMVLAFLDNNRGTFIHRAELAREMDYQGLLTPYETDKGVKELYKKKHISKLRRPVDIITQPFDVKQPPDPLPQDHIKVIEKTSKGIRVRLESTPDNVTAYDIEVNGRIVQRKIPRIAFYTTIFIPLDMDRENEVCVYVLGNRRIIGRRRVKLTLYGLE